MLRLLFSLVSSLATAFVCGEMISEDDAGVKGLNRSRFAYVTLIGPVARRRYRPWFYSALAMANALAEAGSEADFVVLVARSGKDESLTRDEEESLRQIGARWRYAEAPLGKPGFHLGNFKLLAWQHTEYEAIQLLDADVLPKGSMDSFFSLPSLLGSDIVCCPGRVSPLNAGWMAFRPSTIHYERLVKLLEKDDQINDDDAKKPWGHELDRWLSSDGIWKESQGWTFFDAKGNQGHLYSYFRFDAKSLVIFLHAARISYQMLNYTKQLSPDHYPPPTAVLDLIKDK